MKIFKESLTNKINPFLLQRLRYRKGCPDTLSIFGIYICATKTPFGNLILKRK